MSTHVLNILKIIIITLVKLFILALMFVWFCYDFIITLPEFDFAILIYIITMLTCIISFVCSFVNKIKKTSYIIFLFSLLLYVLMNIFSVSVTDSHNADRCLDSGNGVYDFEQHKCRTDCWHWSKEKGCLKE